MDAYSMKKTMELTGYLDNVRAVDTLQMTYARLFDETRIPESEAKSVRQEIHAILTSENYVFLQPPFEKIAAVDVVYAYQFDVGLSWGVIFERDDNTSHGTYGMYRTYFPGFGCVWVRKKDIVKLYRVKSG